MQKSYTALLSVVMLFGMFFPVSASAYFSTGQSATKISENAFLFTVSYRFGHQSREMRLPVGVQRDVVVSDDSSYLGYTIRDDGGMPTDIGTGYGVVLSTANIEGTQYVVPQGVAKDFTALFLLVLSDEEVQILDDIALQVTALPFTTHQDESTLVFELNEHELGAYTTSFIE